MAKVIMTTSQALTILLLKPGAHSEELKTAYRKAALENHPDKGGDPKDFISVQEAYEFLCRHGTVLRQAQQWTVWFQVTGTSTNNTGTVEWFWS